MNTWAVVLLWWIFGEQILGILLDAGGRKTKWTFDASNKERVIGVIVHGAFLLIAAKALGLI